MVPTVAAKCVWMVCENQWPYGCDCEREHTYVVERNVAIYVGLLKHQMIVMRT